MLLKWVDHPEFRKHEQLMGVIYDAGIATRKQLLELTAWNKRSLDNRIAEVRNKAATSEEKNLWLRSVGIPRNDDLSYALGPKGISYVHDMMREESRYREPPEGQAMHFIGTLGILVRLLQSGVQRSQIKWLSSPEATDVLVMWYAEIHKELDRRNFIRPDAYLSIEKTGFWIEYDNDTERTRKLERKFHNYVKTLLPKVDSHPEPIVWVTPSHQRRDYLRDQWRLVVELFYPNQRVPEMRFFSAGEETQWFLGQLVKNPWD